MKPPTLIAEVGCNHRGEVETAMEMVRTLATFCNVDVVKFQKRNVRESLTPEQYDAPHPVLENSYGATYGEHREALEFPLDVHRELQALCHEQGVEYACSVWDMTSAREIASLHPPFIKVPSALNTHTELLTFLRDEYEGQVHVSIGMTTRAEERAVVELFAGHAKLVLYACTSGYPVEFEDLCLYEITHLHGYGHHIPTGFSGHHNGIAADIAAMTLGARWIERHFTLNRTWKGTDHAASLEPDGMRRLARDLKHVAAALTLKPQEILPVEAPQRAKLKHL